MKILIVYVTTEGHTKKIANRIAEELASSGDQVTMLDVADAANWRARDYDRVVVGGSVHFGKFSRALGEWVKANASGLSARSSAFFGVCLGILQKDDPKTQQDVRDIMERFFSATGWRPARSAVFAGALMNSRYNWLKRWLMHRIARKAGIKTDFRHDYDFTDWDEVRDFALVAWP